MRESARVGAGCRVKNNHIKQWVAVQAVAHFLFGMASGVANEGQTGLNLPLPVIE